jgi:excisionase family DNA binding protein
MMTRLNAATSDEARFLTLQQAAAFSGLSEMSLRRLVAAGRLTVYRPLRRKALLDRRQLEALIRGSADAADQATA